MSQRSRVVNTITRSNVSSILFLFSLLAIEFGTANFEQNAERFDCSKPVQYILFYVWNVHRKGKMMIPLMKITLYVWMANKMIACHYERKKKLKWFSCHLNDAISFEMIHWSRSWRCVFLFQTIVFIDSLVVVYVMFACVRVKMLLNWALMLESLSIITIKHQVLSETQTIVYL